MPTESDAETLIVRLRGLLPTLAESERAVGRLVLDQPAETARWASPSWPGEPAPRPRRSPGSAAASGSTGTRNCGLMLAVAGYKQEAAGRQLPIGADAEIAADDPLPAITRKVAIASQQAIQDTFETFDMSALASAVEVHLRCPQDRHLRRGRLRRGRRRPAPQAVAPGPDRRRLLRRALVHGLRGPPAQRGRGDRGVALRAHPRGARPDARRPRARRGHHRRHQLSPLRRWPIWSTSCSPSAGQEDVLFRTGATVSRIAQLYVTDCLFVALAQHRGEQAWAGIRTGPASNIVKDGGERARSARRPN